MTHYAELRDRMVEVQLARRGIRDIRVLDAMRRVPRERFLEFVAGLEGDRPENERPAHERFAA